MIVTVDIQGVAFVGIPKCLTTSILHALYRIEFGEPYKAGMHDGQFIHGFYRDRATEKGLDWEKPDFEALSGYWKFTVVRDPINRMISAYKHRVFQKGEVAAAMERPKWQVRKQGQTEGVVPYPDADTFFSNFQQYRMLVPSIWHHTAPMSHFVGDDLRRFDCVSRIEDIGHLETALSARLGQGITLPHLQKSLSSLTFDLLDDDARKTLLRHTRPDFDLVKDCYRPPVVARSRTV